MAHYDISYEGLDPIAKHNKAIQDIKDYLGNDRFDIVTESAKNMDPPMTLNEFTVAMSFAGVQGYPVKAWYNYIYGL